MSYRPDDPRARLAGALLKDLGHGPDRRAHARFLTPELAVTLGSALYYTIDWGLGALVIGDYDGALAVGAKAALRLAHPAEPARSFTVVARVIRRDAMRRQLTLQYVEISPGLLGWLGDLQLGGGA